MYKKIFWSFKSYVNDEVATQNNLEVGGSFCCHLFLFCFFYCILLHIVIIPYI